MLGFVPENLKCAIYLRVSTDKQAEEGYGLELQEKECRNAIEYKRWILVKIYKDDGYGGTMSPKDRPGLRDLLEDARDEKFEMVVVYSIDRIGRTLGIITEVVDELERLNIGIAARKDNFDTSTAVGKFTMQIIAGVAELDRKAILEKLAKGRLERKKQKGFAGGRARYGYRLVKSKDGNKKEVDINKAEAEIVRKIFKLANEKLTPTQIANKLNNDGDKPKFAELWSRQLIHKILKRKADYEGGIMNDNINNIRWPKIL